MYTGADFIAFLFAIAVDTYKPQRLEPAKPRLERQWCEQETPIRKALREAKERQQHAQICIGEEHEKL